MKRIIAILSAVILLFSCAYAQNTEFAMLRQLYRPGENTVYSPVSLHTALNMAAAGASGVTRDEILACTNDLTTSEIHSANALFLSPLVEIKPDYQSTVQKDFAAEIFPIDADIVEKANRWIREQTNGMIDNFMQNPPADTGLILLNAVAMEKDWRKPFEEENTREEDFFTADAVLSLPMMHQTEDFRYVEWSGAQIVCLPYADSTLEMWIALPEEGAMTDFLAKLSESGMDEPIQSAATREVILSLPKLDTTDENGLVDPLKALGMNEAFTDRADFSGISDTAMYISSISQKARIKMDEKSTSAAAVTQVAFTTMAFAPGSRPEPVVMQVNRPYFFAVRDALTGAICFSGIIENPLL